MAEISKAGQNPIEILVEQNKVLAEINPRLLHYYENIAPELLKREQLVPQEIKTVFETEKEKFYQDLKNQLSDLPQVDMKLSEKDRAILTNTEEYLKKYTKPLYVILGLFLISLFTTILSGYFATQFYQSSVLTQREMKENILSEIKNQGNIIVKNDYCKALENEKIILSQFLNKSEEFSEMYNLYRDGIVESNKEESFFKNIEE